MTYDRTYEHSQIYGAKYSKMDQVNKDKGNPYRFLEGCNDFSVMHDTTCNS